MEHRTIDAEQADAHYAEHVERDFYPPLRDFVTSGPLVALVLEGDEAIEVVRALNGATDGRKAAPGTIRGDLVAVEPREPRARLRLPGVGRARDRDLVPRPLTSRPGARPRLRAGTSRTPDRGRSTTRDDGRESVTDRVSRPSGLRVLPGRAAPPP